MLLATRLARPGEPFDLAVPVAWSPTTRSRRLPRLAGNRSAGALLRRSVLQAQGHGSVEALGAAPLPGLRRARHRHRPKRAPVVAFGTSSPRLLLGPDGLPGLTAGVRDRPCCALHQALIRFRRCLTVSRRDRPEFVRPDDSPARPRATSHVSAKRTSRDAHPSRIHAEAWSWLEREEASHKTSLWGSSRVRPGSAGFEN